ncbi:MAG: ABC transporter ATP-binding protein [Fimbriimonadaceae bacterium]|nr:ABC transporter ATP-binding protein [Fimbriimonadaceae bacterium]QOJ12964.1 MAG: ABC transporter ATP-binding protein [Chthonomonadaceae bacterium]
MAGVRFNGIGKVFGKDVHAVRDLNLEIADQEFMVLVGPSGCGKTTALRMVAGLEEATTGDIFIGDRRVNDVPPKDRDIAMVFQNYALYPHMNVYDNIAFGLRLRELKGVFWQLSHLSQARKVKGDIDRRVRETAAMLGIETLLHRKPKELSGGQRQRVALGRAIVRQPKVFLMDEPLSNLDAKLRIQTRAELIRLHRSLQITTIYVTHDQVEAMTMGQRIAVMKDGVLQQCDVPEVVYNQPANKFVAGFIGSPPMNFVEARIRKEGAKVWIDAADFKLPLNGTASAGVADGQVVWLGIRPEAIFDAKVPSSVKASQENTLQLKIDVLEPLGHEYVAYLTTGKHNLIATLDPTSKVKEAESAEFLINLDEIHVFDAETEQAIR